MNTEYLSVHKLKCTSSLDILVGGLELDHEYVAVLALAVVSKAKSGDAVLGDLNPLVVLCELFDD